jgi:hypothetical protein
MADASDTTGACARCSDKNPTAPTPHRVPDSLPYADLGIAGDGGDNYLAGAAMLAELTRSLNSRRKEAGEMSQAECDAADEVARRKEDEGLAELTGPAQGLDDVLVKVAYAFRVGWYSMHGNGPYGDAGLALLGSAMSDLVLLREADINRRFHVREEAA